MFIGLTSRYVPAGRAAEPTGPLSVGAATSNITPALGVSISGHMADRKATHIHDELHARCLVFDNSRTRVAIVVCDSCMIPGDIFDEAKALAQEETGILAEHMLMAATHTHSAATSTACFQSEPDAEYRRFLVRRIADGIRRAVNNLAPARIGWGSGSKPEHVFNRRWRMKPGTIPPNPFGKQDQVKMNPPQGSPDLLEPAGPTDPELPVISVQSRDGRPITLLANYALHYVGGNGAGDISADYFGMFADRVQQLLNADRLDPPFVGIMTNGASGNINNINFRQRGPARKPYEQMRLVAHDVAAEAVRVVKDITYTDQVVLAARQERIRLGVRRPTDDEAMRAQMILAAATAANKPLTSLEQVYANETEQLADYPEEVELILQTLRIGDIALVAIPCEIFVEIGLELKEKSPFKPTIVVNLANGYNGYLPTAEHHALGGYETWRARSSYLETGAAAVIVERMVSLLNQMK
ncbi:MAG: hypothetical protein AMXMBFR13_02930 [Phycisphaerae bacterium]